MTLRRVLFSAFALTGWLLAGLQGFLLYNILFHPFDDPISLAARHTEELLALHERYDQTDKVIAWLEMYHGEAPGHQVMSSFVDWATNNAAAAENLLARLPPAPIMAERLAFAVTDSGQIDDFCKAYASSASQGVKDILNKIGRYRPACR